VFLLRKDDLIIEDMLLQRKPFIEKLQLNNFEVVNCPKSSLLAKRPIAKPP
jgi:hypothetical protein